MMQQTNVAPKSLRLNSFDLGVNGAFRTRIIGLEGHYFIKILIRIRILQPYLPTNPNMFEVDPLTTVKQACQLLEGVRQRTAVNFLKGKREGVHV